MEFLGRMLIDLGKGCPNCGGSLWWRYGIWSCGYCPSCGWEEGKFSEALGQGKTLLEALQLSTSRKEVANG